MFIYVQSHFHTIKHQTKVKLPSLPWRVPLNVAILRLADEAQSLQVPVNQGMAPGARLVVVDVEKSNDPGVYKAWGFGMGAPGQEKWRFGRGWQESFLYVPRVEELLGRVYIYMYICIYIYISES